MMWSFCAGWRICITLANFIEPWHVSHVLDPSFFSPNKSIHIILLCSREFTHRVKSVSMSKFTSQEVEALQNGGNQVYAELSFSLKEGVCLFSF